MGRQAGSYDLAVKCGPHTRARYFKPVVQRMQRAHIPHKRAGQRARTTPVVAVEYHVPTFMKEVVGASEALSGRQSHLDARTPAVRLCSSRLDASVERGAFTAACVDLAGATIRPLKQASFQMMTLSSGRTALINLHSGTPITTSATSRRCTSITWRAAPRW